ncbi:kinase-like domain-containing protein [Rhodocollybia butyracea]|uniref:Kinase-like domain-containing protein n=1 Tax=Rhodocollybia butyracea TaxID=206335 RepID=A0A9P5Q7Y8_9AGAR|nr:kinase-like domain-containing protein [Rhodocollybia butyracea]
MVLPFYEHGNVHQYLTRNSQSSNRQRMILEIASGMQHLHNNGIIHGGLRPTNIFMTADGHIVISEYGLFELQQTTRDTEAYRYFSPETWKGTVSKPSDVYSFAMCALQILTSVLPWGSLSEKYVFSLVVYEKTRPDRPETSRLTDDIWNIIVSAWHQEPGYRPTFDLIVRLWRANSLQIEPIQTTRTSSFHMSRYHSGVSVGSGSDHSVGPPAYEDEHMPTPENMPTSAPPATQQFAFNGTETATSPAEARPHGYSWYSSANSRDSIGNSPPNSAPPTSLQFPINEGAGNRAVERTPPNTAPPGHQFPSNEDITNFSMRPQSPSHSWFSTRGVAPQSSGSSSSDRSLDSPVTSLESPMSTHRSRARLSFSPKHVYGTASPRDDASSAFHRIGHNLGQALPRLDPIQSQDEYTPRWELASPSSYGGLRRQRSFSDISIKTESSGTKSA